MIFPPFDVELWERWSVIHQSTQQIAVALRITEAEVYNRLARIREQRRAA